MKTVKLGFSRLNIPEKIQKARLVVAKMTGNNNFPDPHPPLEEMTAAADLLEQVYTDAQDGSKVKKVEMRQRSTELNVLLIALGAYVQSISKGDEQLILGSGFDARAQRIQISGPANPEGVRGVATSREGEVLVRWNRVAKAGGYVVQMSTDGNNWTQCGVCKRAKLVLSGLEGGAKIWFRVAAVGAEALSGWSDAGTVRAN